MRTVHPLCRSRLALSLCAALASGAARGAGLAPLPAQPAGVAWPTAE
jgi:hypothetical protein